jgi:hypothetical protein
MELSFQDFGQNVPQKPRYVRGIDYLLHEFDLGVEDTLYLVSQLKHNRSSVSVVTLSGTVNFYIFDDQLNVQIDGSSSGFWHASNIDLTIARTILETASAGCEDFGSQIPGTNCSWDVY